MKKRNIKVIITAIIGISMLISGCSVKQGGSSNSSEGVTLKVLTNRIDIVDTELKRFGEEYKNKTGVNIEWEAIQNYDEDVQVRIRSNNNYGDVLIIPAISSEEYEKYLEPLGKSSDPDIAEYTISTRTAIKENGDYTVYGLSYGLGAQGIVYNKKAFEEAGISAESMKTFEGFYEGCEKLKSIGVIPVATNFKDSWTLSNWFTTAKCMSGQADFENKLYKEESVFDSSKPIGQMLAFTENIISNGWVEEDLLNTDWEQSKQDLADGKVGMMFLGTWIISQEKAIASNPDDIGFMAIPTADGTTYTFLEPDYRLGVSNKSKHKKEARDFLFAFNESDYAANNGFIPNNSKLTEMDPVIEEFLNSGVNSLVQESAEEEDAGKTSELFSKAYIKTDTLVQKPFLYSSIQDKERFDKTIESFNKDWNTAKKDLGY